MAKKRRKQTETAAALFGCYGILMLYLLFIRGRHAVEGIPYWEQVLNNYNLIPFHTVGNYWHILTNREYYVEKWEAYSVYRYHARHAFINLAGNVAMFVPLGFLLPAASEKKRTFFRTFFNKRSSGITKTKHTGYFIKSLPCRIISGFSHNLKFTVITYIYYMTVSA